MWREKNIYFTEHDIYFSKLMFILKNINLELKPALRTKYIFYRILLYLLIRTDWGRFNEKEHSVLLDCLIYHRQLCVMRWHYGAITPPSPLYNIVKSRKEYAEESRSKPTSKGGGRVLGGRGMFGGVGGCVVGVE